MQTDIKDELLAAIVTTPQPGQLLAAVSIRLPYAAQPTTQLIDLSAVPADAAAALTSSLNSRKTASTAESSGVDSEGLAEIQRFAPAFLLWENGFRANPAAFLSDDEIRVLEESDLATQRAAYFVLCLRSAATTKPKYRVPSVSAGVDVSLDEFGDTDIAESLLELYLQVAKLHLAVSDNDRLKIFEHSVELSNMAMMLLDVCVGIETVAAVPKTEMTEGGSA